MKKYSHSSLMFILIAIMTFLFLGCGTTFIEAVKEGNSEIVKEKINNKSEDVNLSNGVFYACREGKLDVLKILIKNGADPNDDGNDWTPLYLAAYNGYDNIVDFLIQNGADVNKLCNSEARIIKDNYVEEKDGKFYYQFIKTNKGETPLSAAVEKGNLKIVSMLLKNGANPNSTVLWEEAYHNCGGGFAAEGYSYSNAISIEGKLRTINIDKQGNAVSNVKPRFDKRFTLLQLSKDLKFDNISNVLVEYGAVE